MMLKKTAITLAVALSGTAPMTHAADASPFTLTANVNLVSDYYFRGLSQTWHKPALQGGADVSHSSGLYAGVWSSNVSGNQYAGGSQEIDYYGGYNAKVNDDLTLTVGGYGYYYPGANYSKATSAVYERQSYNTFELNAGATWKWLSGKYSYSLTDYFGINQKTGYDGKSKGTGYLELNASYNVTDDIAIAAHAGWTHITAKLANGATTVGGASDPSYKDYKLGVTKSFKDGWNVGLAYVKASNTAFYDKTASAVGSDTSDLGEGRVVVSAGRSF